MSQAAMNQGKSVLVVDDDPGIRAFMAIALRMEGFVVDTAADGAEALDKARQTHPDAIVLDLMMPGMDGRDFVKAWRAEPANKQAPVVMMSASDSRFGTDVPGVAAFLAKPFDLETLLGKLDSLMM